MSRQRRDLSLDQKIEILRTCSGKSVRSIAERYGIGKTQAGNILRRRRELIAAYEDCQPGCRKRQRRGQSGDVDNLVWSWFKHMLLSNVTVTGPAIQKQAVEFAQAQGRFDFKASNGWLDRWKKRHSVRCCKVVDGASVSERLMVVGCSDRQMNLPRDVDENQAMASYHDDGRPGDDRPMAAYHDDGRPGDDRPMTSYHDDRRPDGERSGPQSFVKVEMEDNGALDPIEDTVVARDISAPAFDASVSLIVGDRVKTEAEDFTEYLVRPDVSSRDFVKNRSSKCDSVTCLPLRRAAVAHLEGLRAIFSAWGMEQGLFHIAELQGLVEALHQ